MARKKEIFKFCKIISQRDMTSFQNFYSKCEVFLLNTFFQNIRKKRKFQDQRCCFKISCNIFSLLFALSDCTDLENIYIIHKYHALGR